MDKAIPDLAIEINESLHAAIRDVYNGVLKAFMEMPEKLLVEKYSAEYDYDYERFNRMAKGAAEVTPSWDV